MKTWITWASGVLLSVPLVAAAQGDVIARTAQATVTSAEIEALAGSLNADTRARLSADPAAADRLVRATLAQKAALAEAKAKGWDRQPQVKAALDQAQRDIIVRSYLGSVAAPAADYPPDAEIQATYDRNRAAFAVPRALHLAQIYLTKPSGADTAAVDRIRKQAADLARQARGGDFAALAGARSQDAASAARGGDMGYVPETDLLPAIRQAADDLKPGQVSAPVELPAGFHVMKLLDVRAAGALPIADVKERIRAALREQRAQQNAQAYLTKLEADAPIDENALRKAFDNAR
ncbi:peptidylprolyl isomerase [Burkholderia alba]|uniref:peptidylprolyl isomerase n=1 Tax=Burkholderia alba TaxID=2683677 RepID=UPI002B0558F4|nr:peptidylprolyl isomerase [Burkholderia alba]